MLHAVIVGIDTYSDARISPLQAARADAEAVARLFDEGIVNAERTVQILLNAAATRGAIMRAIGEVLPRRQRSDDLIVIYFAGHGSPEQRNPPDRISRYLVPHDADYNHVFATGIGLETELVTLLERQNAGRILMVLDSCFSGKAGGRTFLGPKLAQRIGQYRAPLSLRHLELGAGRVILAACGDAEVAIERHDHGIFTRHFLAILSTARRETVGIGELYDELYARVSSETNHLQNPVLKGNIEGFRFPLLNGENRSPHLVE